MHEGEGECSVLPYSPSLTCYSLSPSLLPLLSRRKHRQQQGVVAAAAKYIAAAAPSSVSLQPEFLHGLL
jgi:hypothetical protein